MHSIRLLSLSLLLRLGLALLPALGTGCAAMTNPTVDGIPVRRLPEELLAGSKAGQQTIPLQTLKQPVPPEYRLSAGDVLGILVDGFLGERTQPLPQQVGPRNQSREGRTAPASLGYPVTVEADGTIALPMIPPILAAGKSVPELREEILAKYLDKGLLKKDTAVVMVSMMQARTTSVLVLRQESQSFQIGPEGTPQSSSKRGMGYEIDLQGYENDVLHALARTGGLPGLDAYNEIVIQRSCFRQPGERSALLRGAGPTGPTPLATLDGSGEVIRIPLRMPCGQVPAIRPEDVILRTGDVVFLEARDDQVFYTGGLLPTGMYLLPRDRDLDVLEAVSLVRGPLFNGAFGGNNLSGALLAPGIGNPSPSQLTVLRRTPGGGQVNIRVDLRRAMREPSERMLMKAGDVLLLQETPGEAMTRYFTQTFFNFNLFWRVISGPNVAGVIDVSAADRLPGRLGTYNINDPQR